MSIGFNGGPNPMEDLKRLAKMNGISLEDAQKILQNSQQAQLQSNSLWNMAGMPQDDKQEYFNMGLKIERNPDTAPPPPPPPPVNRGNESLTGPVDSYYSNYDQFLNDYLAIDEIAEQGMRQAANPFGMQAPPPPLNGMQQGENPWGNPPPPPAPKGMQQGNPWGNPPPPPPGNRGNESLTGPVDSYYSNYDQFINDYLAIDEIAKQNMNKNPFGR